MTLHILTPFPPFLRQEAVTPCSTQKDFKIDKRIGLNHAKAKTDLCQPLWPLVPCVCSPSSVSVVYNGGRNEQGLGRGSGHFPSMHGAPGSIPRTTINNKNPAITWPTLLVRKRDPAGTQTCLRPHRAAGKSKRGSARSEMCSAFSQHCAELHPLLPLPSSSPHCLELLRVTRWEQTWWCPCVSGVYRGCSRVLGAVLPGFELCAAIASFGGSCCCYSGD